jgi:hypothetical protein
LVIGDHFETHDVGVVGSVSRDYRGDLELVSRPARLQENNGTTRKPRVISAVEIHSNVVVFSFLSRPDGLSYKTNVLHRRCSSGECLISIRKANKIYVLAKKHVFGTGGEWVGDGKQLFRHQYCYVYGIVTPKN